MVDIVENQRKKKGNYLVVNQINSVQIKVIFWIINFNFLTKRFFENDKIAYLQNLLHLDGDCFVVDPELSLHELSCKIRLMSEWIM